MKVHTIEIAAAIEQELKKYLDDWGGGYPMRFSRFIDLGGRQTDLHAYSAKPGTPPWLIARIKSVMKSEQGECIQIFVTLTGPQKKMEEVLVSPELWKLPALADRVLKFAKNEMLSKISEGGGSLEGGDASLGNGTSGSLGSGSSDDDEDLEDIDTSGILAGDGDSGADFDPSAMIAEANEEGGSDDVSDPSDLIRQLNEEEEDK